MSVSEFTAEQFTEIREEFRGYMAELVEKRRAEPSEDLMSAMVEAREERDRLSEIELIDMGQVLLVAGHEVTAAQLSNFLLVLRQHPDRLAELRADRTLLPDAVEELSRYVALSGIATFRAMPRRTSRWAARWSARASRCWRH
jgi:cytochrome P450